SSPLLTPSGRAFDGGGTIRNISSDPLAPCIMYWPDNEPFPEQGQIKPPRTMAVTVQPPILNTGHQGPIYPACDWICRKCNYWNWRRRKVCQTCFPFAEGNSDSTSAVLQKRRIDLLISVLERTCCAAPGPACALSSTHRCHPSLVVSKPPRGPSQYTAAPLGLHRFHSQRQVISADDNYVDSFLPPLLPAFFQDIVGTSSLDEYPDSLSSSTFSSYSGDHSVTEAPLGNIWRLDGEETKWSSGFPL
ncbi:hypothetical protein B0H13DRAFT_1545762, partial [Mycena leptocephala]